MKDSFGVFAGDDLHIRKVFSNARAAQRVIVVGVGKENVIKTAVTKADIMKIKDSEERQRAIAENIDLFRKG